MSKKKRKKSTSESLSDSFIDTLISDTKKGLIKWTTLDGFRRANGDQIESETWWCCVYGGRGVYVRFVPGINVASSPRPIALHVSNHHISDVYSLKRAHIADTYTSSKLLQLSRCIQEWRISSMIKTETELRAGQSEQAKLCEDALTHHVATDKECPKSHISSVEIVILSLLVLLSIANLAIEIAKYIN
jgi:hypothetical protein